MQSSQSACLAAQRRSVDAVQNYGIDHAPSGEGISCVIAQHSSLPPRPRTARGRVACSLVHQAHASIVPRSTSAIHVRHQQITAAIQAAVQRAGDVPGMLFY